MHTRLEFILFPFCCFNRQRRPPPPQEPDDVQAPQSRTFKRYHYHFKEPAAALWTYTRSGMLYGAGRCLPQTESPPDIFILSKLQPTTYCMLRISDFASCVSFHRGKRHQCSVCLCSCCMSSWGFAALFLLLSNEWHMKQITTEREREGLNHMQASDTYTQNKTSTIWRTWYSICYVLSKKAGRGPTQCSRFCQHTSLRHSYFNTAEHTDLSTQQFLLQH